jgi:hypothetical protein
MSEWKLPEPPEGHQWYAPPYFIWEKLHLPDGYRPMMVNEVIEVGDEYRYEPNTWLPYEDYYNRPTKILQKGCGWCPHRTKRPLPINIDYKAETEALKKQLDKYKWTPCGPNTAARKEDALNGKLWYLSKDEKDQIWIDGWKFSEGNDIYSHWMTPIPDPKPVSPAEELSSRIDEYLNNNVDSKVTDLLIDIKKHLNEN